MKVNGNGSESVLDHAINGKAAKTFSGVVFTGSVDGLTCSASRFYPEQLPSFPHEPTRDRFTIRFIGDGVGEGVTSLVAFEPGEIVFGFTGFFSNEVTQFTLQIAEGLHLHDPYFYGKLLHSCNPNTYVDVAKRQFIALKPIAPGEFVTLDYARTEDYLFRSFPCSCGALNCRGYVAGRKQQADVNGLPQS